LKYNEQHGITPQQAIKSGRSIFTGNALTQAGYMYADEEMLTIAADPVVAYMDRAALEKAVAVARQRMEAAAKALDFAAAALFRDEMYALQKRME